MAGTCLLIRKAHSSEQDFEQLKSQGEKHIQDILGKYFKDIRFYAADENSWLIHFRKNEEEKFIADKDGWMIFEGTVFDLNKTRVHGIESLREHYRFCKNIEDFANSLDGHFVIKIYDAPKKCYYVINDFIRYKTHFYAESKDYLCYSSYSYLTAMITSPDADLHAINEYMWRYYILSERSFLRNTHRMEMASLHVIENDIVKKRRYWDWPQQFSEEPFRRQVELMTENMQESARLLGTNYHPNMDFTQGQDSRQLIAAMLNQKQDFSTSIFGKSDFYEARATEEIAKRHGIKHYSITLEDDFTQDPLKHFERAVIYGSGEEPGNQLGRILYMREKQFKWGGAVCNGMTGHFYKNGLWDEMYTFNFYREPKAFKVDMFLDLRMLSQNYDDRIFIPEIRKIKNGSGTYFRDIINHSIADMKKAPIALQVDKFDQLHWLNFTAVSNSSSDSIGIALSPLLFRRNMEDALKVPVKWKFNLSKFQRALVYGLHPRLAAEKTNFGGVNMVPKNIITYPFFILRYGWHQSSRLRNKYLQKLGFHPKTHLQEAWDYLPLYKTLYAQIREKGYTDIRKMAMGGLLSEKAWEDINKKTELSDSLSDYEYIFKIVTMERFYALANNIHKAFDNLR